jgi:hypothetical protein
MSKIVGIVIEIIVTYAITVGSWIGVAYLAGLIFDVTPSYIIVAIIATVLYVLNALFVLGGRAK